MFKETSYFIIYYSNKDIKYIDELINFLDIEIEKIIKFFEIKKLKTKIEITLYDDINKLWECHDNFFNSKEKYGDFPKWVCGFSLGNKIFTVGLEELKKVNNKESSKVDDLKKLILHETIHSIHFSINRETVYIKWLSEGLATTLSKQYDNDELIMDSKKEELLSGNCYYHNFRSVFSYLLEKYGKEYILKLITNSKFCDEEISLKFQEIYDYYNNKG